MQELKLFDAEHRFMEVIWDLEPVNSTELSKVCSERLGWKKPTTYTMIRKLVQRGILQNENATVIALVTREQIQRYESEELLQKSFGGSLPAFLATFLRDKKLTQAEADRLRKMIEDASK